MQAVAVIYRQAHALRDHYRRLLHLRLLLHCILRCIKLCGIILIHCLTSVHKTLAK